MLNINVIIFRFFVLSIIDSSFIFIFFVFYVRCLAGIIMNMGKCLNRRDKKVETIVESFHFINQHDLSHTKYLHLNPKRNIICALCRGHGFFNDLYWF